MSALFRSGPTPEPADGIASNGRLRESVWDYPRPPRIEREDRLVEVSLQGRSVARSNAAVRVLETAGAPAVYIPPADIEPGALVPVGGGSFCEWKGAASYYDVEVAGVVVPKAAWTYLEPTAAFGSITDFVSFYPRSFDCRLDGEAVEPQPGGFYGGWVTAEICGPIKGESGSAGW